MPARTTILATLALLPGLALADAIFQYRDPGGGTLFTDRDVMPQDYTLLDVRKGWTFEPRPLTPELRDQYDLEIEYAASAYNIEPGLIKAVIHAESHFERYAQSRAGAQGLMQLMPATAAFLDVHNVYDPRQNILGGARYLQYLQERFDDTTLILAAYNAGEGNVRRHGGIPPFEETQGYVTKVMQLLPRYREQFSRPDRSFASRTPPQ